jgi:hypothetical protein
MPDIFGYKYKAENPEIRFSARCRKGREGEKHWAGCKAHPGKMLSRSGDMHSAQRKLANQTWQHPVMVILAMQAGRHHRHRGPAARDQFNALIRPATQGKHLCTGLAEPKVAA